MTAGDPREGFRYAGIDAISAASRTKNINSDHLSITSEIDNILMKMNLSDLLQQFPVNRTSEKPLCREIST